MKVLVEREVKTKPAPPSRTYRCHCSSCNSYLEYTTEDLTQGHESGCWLIYCPVCQLGTYQSWLTRWWNRVRPISSLSQGTPR